MKKFKNSLLALGMSVTCFSGSVGAIPPSKLDALEKAEGRTLDWGDAYEVALENGASAMWAEIYATQMTKGKPISVAFRYANAYEDAYLDAKHRNIEEQWVRVYATKIAEGHQDEWATVYATQYESKLIAERSVTWAKTYANERADGKSNNWATVYATQYESKLIAKEPDAWARDYATARADGHPDDWATIYATQIELKNQYLWARKWAVAYANAKAKGHTDNWADNYADEIVSGRSDKWADCYATKREERKSHEWAEAYAYAIEKGETTTLAAKVAKISILALAGDLLVGTGRFAYDRDRYSAYAYYFVEARRKHNAEIRWADAYARAKAFKRSDKWAAMYADKLESKRKAGRTVEWANDYACAYSDATEYNKKSPEFADTYATRFANGEYPLEDIVSSMSLPALKEQHLEKLYSIDQVLIEQ